MIYQYVNPVFSYTDYLYMFENDVMLFMPQIFLLVSSIGLLVYGVCTTTIGLRFEIFGIMSTVFALILSANVPCRSFTLFLGALRYDALGTMFVNGILLSTLVCFCIGLEYIRKEIWTKVEYIVLIQLCVLSLVMLVGANDLISLYLAIEFQSLCLYILAGFNRSSSFSAEAGLKYGVLGSFSSGLLIIGCCLMYSSFGTTNFTDIGYCISCISSVSSESSLSVYGMWYVGGLTLVTVGLLFKISSFPFHMWSPDVYEGANTSSTAFFAIVTKISIIGILVKELVDKVLTFPGVVDVCILICCVGSLAIGAFGAICQNKIKRFLAFSSINHVGFLLMGIYVSIKDPSTYYGIRSTVIYLLLYVLMTSSLFSILMIGSQKKRRMNRISPWIEVRNDKNSHLSYLSDFSGSGKSSRCLSIVLALTLFSVAGIPPLGGFWSKAEMILTMMHFGEYVLALIAVFLSVMTCFYYLRVIKIMFFERVSYKSRTLLRISKSSSYVLSTSTVILASYSILEESVSWCIHGATIVSFFSSV